MRIQFTVNDAEYLQMKAKADEKGFPNVAEFVKSLALGGKNSLADLYIEVCGKIDKLPDGKEFCIRDLIPNPPALLGRWIFKGVDNGDIHNVVSLGNKEMGAERYKKQFTEKKE
jgi:predicted ester cyclase